VHHPHVVAMQDDVNHRPERFSRVLFGVVRAFYDAVKQLTPLRQLHDDVHVVLCVCMCACVCMCVHVYVCVLMCAHLLMCVCAYVCVSVRG